MGSLRQVDIAHAFAAVARDLTTQAGVAATTDRVAAVAAKLVGCGWAAVGRLSPRQSLTFEDAHDDPVLSTVAAVASDTGESVALESLRLRRTVRAANLATERRWPSFAARIVAETPIRAALAFFLRLDEADLGVLALYSREPGYFTDELCELGAIYADHAAIALSRALDHDRVENLEKALQSNREIGVALGVLMSRYAITQQQAFDLLRTVSQRSHRKLRELASDVAFTGELPDIPGPLPVDDVASADVASAEAS